MSGKRGSLFRRFVFPAIVVLGVGVLLLWQQSSSLARRLTLRALEKKYPHLTVELDSVRLVDTRGVRLRGLRLYDSNDQKSPKKLLWETEEVFAEIPIRPATFFSSSVFPRRVVLRRPTLYLDRMDAEIGKILSKLMPVRLPNEPFCPMEVVGGAIALTDPVPHGPEPTVLWRCNGVTAAILPPGFTAESLSETAGAFERNHRSGPNETESAEHLPDRSDLWRIEAAGENAQLKRLTLSAVAAADWSDWRLTGAVDSFEVVPETLTSFFAPNETFRSLETLQGRTSFDFSAQKDVSEPEGFRYALSGKLFRGSLVLSILEHPITDLFVEFAAGNRSLTVKRLTGRSGPVLLLADYTQSGSGSDQTATFRTQLEEFPLSLETLQKLRAQRPGKGFAFLDRPELAGLSFQTTAKVLLTFNLKGGGWKPREIGLTCRDLSVEGGKLPRRFDGFSGKLILDEHENLSFDFESGEEPKKIIARGVFASVLSEPVGEARIEAAGMTLDDKLFEPLSPGCRGELSALHPTGTLDMALTVRRTQPAAGELGTGVRQDVQFNIGVRDAAIRYDRFPFPIGQISGMIQCRDNVWSFTNFRGTGGSAEFKATGSLRPRGENQGSELALDLKIDRFPVGEELSGALVDPKRKELVEKLRLSGKVNADVKVGYLSNEQKFSLEFTAEPIPGAVSAQPEYFPYELKELEGTLLYRNGELSVRNLRGKNGPMSFRCDVASRFSPDGTWHIGLLSLAVDQLQMDHQLENAIPPSMLKLVSALKLSGYFNTSGTILFRRTAPDAAIEALWDTEVVLNQNIAAFARPIESICGKARLWGMTSELGEMTLAGELDLDSLIVRNVQVTRLTGPFYYAGKEILFGNAAPEPAATPLFREDFFRQRLPNRTAEWTPNRTIPVRSEPMIIRSQSGTFESTGFSQPRSVPAPNDPANPFNINPPPAAQTAAPAPLLAAPDPGASLASLQAAETTLAAGRPLRAELFGGSANLNGRVLLNDPISYQLGFLLRDGSLEEAGRDLTTQTKPINGRITAYADLAGEGKNIGTLKGNGGLVITDAALYEVPQVIKLFQSLSVQEPDRAAFNSCYVDFSVYGNQLALKRVTLEGNALTLFGDGALTLVGGQQLLDLTMNSRLGNAKNRIPVLSDVLGGAGDQISQVRVEGPLSDPSVWQERFPNIKKAWWSIFPETVPESNPKPDQHRRGLFGGVR